VRCLGSERRLRHLFGYAFCVSFYFIRRVSFSFCMCFIHNHFCSTFSTICRAGLEKKKILFIVLTHAYSRASSFKLIKLIINITISTEYIKIKRTNNQILSLLDLKIISSTTLGRKTLSSFVTMLLNRFCSKSTRCITWRAQLLRFITSSTR
jgi:hypothetical protein